jgi:hypothetical protein
MATTGSVPSIAFHISWNVVIGLSPAISRATDDTATATTVPMMGAAAP